MKNTRPNKRRTVIDILKMKGNEIISCLTAYDVVTAGLLDRAGCDILLVGDSLGNVVLGYDTTIPVTMEDIIHPAKAVSRGSSQALLVADMPFLSYQTDQSKAIENAGRLLQAGGVQAVKLEGGSRNQKLIETLTNIGIPVMGHLGVLPQSVNASGGYKRIGNSNTESEFLIHEAQVLEKAGVFALVLECVHHDLAAEITGKIKIPTIGIGSGDACDGQVLVINDLLGYNLTPPPSFVSPVLNLASQVQEAVGSYVQKLKKRTL
jgi:3-methyl-2-oxobutanoate hydroxymethyltransferase